MGRTPCLWWKEGVRGLGRIEDIGTGEISIETPDSDFAYATRQVMTDPTSDRIVPLVDAATDTSKISTHGTASTSKRPGLLRRAYVRTFTKTPKVVHEYRYYSGDGTPQTLTRRADETTSRHRFLWDHMLRSRFATYVTSRQVPLSQDPSVITQTDVHTGVLAGSVGMSEHPRVVCTVRLPYKLADSYS